MLGYGLWQRRFGGDPAVIGSTQVLNGESYAVVGVLPRDFVIPNAETDVVAPLHLAAEPRRTNRGTNFLPADGAAETGRHASAGRARIRRDHRSFAGTISEDNGNLTTPRVVPLQDEVVGGYRQSLLVLLGAVGVVLLIACSNLANLQMARAAARQKEMAIRTALGATGWHLLRQLLAEGMVLAFLGGALGFNTRNLGQRSARRTQPG